MYNLCSQHLQSLNPVQQKLNSRSKICSRLQADLDLPGKLTNDPFALLSRDGSDGCLEVMEGLGVVLIHPVLEVTPQRDLEGSGLVSAVTTPGCTWCWRIQIYLQRQGAHLEHIFERL